MQKTLTLVLFFIPILSYGQLSGTVKDSITNKAIPYVNIWVEGKEIGTSSNNEGYFSLNDTSENHTIIFSAVGYATKKINNFIPENIIYLTPEDIELPELLVIDNKVPKEYVITPLKKSQVKGHFGASDVPGIVAKFIRYKEKYDDTPFIKSLRFFSNSKVKDAIVNIRFFEVDEDGKPGKNLSAENILITVPKGRKIIDVNMEKHQIFLPKNGIFIGFEQLIIGRNRYMEEYTLEGDKTKKKYFHNLYAPFIGYKNASTNENSFIFSRGYWINYPFHPGNNGSIPELVLEVILTN